MYENENRSDREPPGNDLFPPSDDGRAGDGYNDERRHEVDGDTGENGATHVKCREQKQAAARRADDGADPVETVEKTN